MKSRKVISLILVFSMIFALLPSNMNNVWAAETNISEMDALSALGIDSSTPPEGYDENDTSNPYGKDTVTVNPIDELYVVGLSKDTSKILTPHLTNNTTSSTINIDQNLNGTIYGHNDNSSKNTLSIMNHKTDTTIATGNTTATGDYVNLSAGNSYLQTDNYLINTSMNSSSTGTFSIAASKVVNGNFDGNKKGKSSQTALVYAGGLSEHGGLYMRIGDTLTGEYGSAKEVIPTSKSIGNPSDKITDIKENFATDPYLMQNYLQVTTGDYDNDGTDEIAAYIPEYGGSRIVVFKLKKTTGQSNTAYRDSSQWEVAWTYSLKETNYVSNMVSLVSGDFNEDGTDDLGATWGYYYGPGTNKGSKAVIMLGSTGKMLQSSKEFDLTYGSSNIVRASFTFGDLTGSGDNVLILGGQSEADIAAGKIYSRYVAVYSWNGSSFIVNTSNNFDLFEKKDGKFVNAAMGANNNKFYSSPLCPANLAVVSQGLSEKAYLYFDSLFIQYGDDGLVITAALDQAGANSGNTEYYLEYGAVSGDLVGLGYDTVATMQQTMSSSETKGDTTVEWKWYYRNWFYKWFNIKSWYPIVTTASCSMLIPNDTNMIVMDVKNNYKTKTKVDPSTSMSMQNTDEDTSYLKYTGTHYFTYTDPKVLAVLASPPYFSDLLNRDDLSGNYAESTTNYSSTKGSGGADTFNTTIEIGAYVSVEQEFSVFGVVVASAEAEVAITAGFTYEMEKMKMLEQTISYSATSGEDMIAFYSIPLEIYEYSAFTSNGNGTYTEQKMTVNIPHTASVQLLSLKSYENIAKDYDALPQISGTILTHTLGDLSTYSSSANGYLNPIVYDGDWSKVSYSSTGGGSSIAQEIAMSSEKTDSYNFSGKIETKVGAGAGGVKVGVTFGAEFGGGWVDISTSGNSFSGELQNMPIEAEEYGYGYNWKIFSYLHDDGSNKFPVVDYLVTDVVVPPSLPEDFKQNVEKTTDTDIAFTWTYEKQIAGFQIYRYYEFPDGSGSYELKFIPMTKGIYDASDKLYHFEYIDKNLSPYTDYQYQIQSVRASVPNNSIPSEVIIARTKTDVGYPQFSLEGLDEDGLLRIYPDSESNVTVGIINSEDYPGGISYQWQRFVDGVWTDIAGKTSTKLTFKSSGVSDETRYRCRANVIYFDEVRGNNYYISAYSDEFNTRYSKRIPVIVDTSFKATTFNNDTGGTGVNIGLNLISGNSKHYEAPTGNVTFAVTGTDYYVEHTVGLNVTGTTINDGKKVSKAELSISNLPAGVYEVSAYYGGSRVFRSLTSDDNVSFLVGNSGYQLLLENNSKQSTSFTYGDVITPKLKYLENNAGTTTVSDINVGVTYKIKDSTIVPYVGDFNTPNVGSYTIEAVLSGSGVVAERGFNVAKKDLTIKAVDKSDIGKGYVSVNPPTMITKPSNAMAFNEELNDLNLVITATNSAGNKTILDNSTDPGNYTIIAGTSSSTDPVKYNNYNVTYETGTYTIIGQKYFVTIKAEQYQGRDVGTVVLSNSSDGLGAEFSATTKLFFYAVPYSGYEVDSWSAIVTNTATEISLDESQYNANKTTLSMIMKDEPITVAAKFRRSKTTLTTAIEGIGNITCDNPSFINGGEVGYGAELKFTAEPIEGYNFKEWRIESGGASKTNEGIQNEDGTNSLIYTMGVANTTLRAVFARDSYTITLTDNLEAVYTYKIGEDVLSKTVYSGAKIVGDTEVLVKVKSGYTTVEDAVWTVNGEVITPSIEGYKFNIDKDTEISVGTEQLFYDITKTAENGKLSVNISGNDTDVLADIPGGSAVIITAYPDHGYKFDSFTVTGTDKYTVNGYVLTIAELGANVEITANFVKSTDYEITVNYGNSATVIYILYDSFGEEAERGTVATGNYIEVCNGDNITLSVTPKTGYMVDKWIIDDIVYDTKNKMYTIDNISKNMFIKVDVISQISYTVNYSVDGGNGNITSASTDGRSFLSGDTDVGGNSTLMISSSPVSGYMVDKWTVNGKEVKNINNSTFVGKTLKVDGLTSQSNIVDIRVYFTPQVDYQVTYNKTNVTIDSEYTPNDAATDGYVRDEAKAIFTVTPDEGYRIVSVKVEGEDSIVVQNKDSSTDDYFTWTATVNEVNAELTVTAVAKKIHKITIDSVNGGNLDTTTTTNNKKQAIEGETVKVTQDSDLDYTFDGWNVIGTDEVTVNGNTNIGFSFEMPDSDVAVNADFKQISTIDIDYDVYDSNGSEEDGYNGTVSAKISRANISGYPKTVASATTKGAITSICRGWTDEYVTWPMSTVTFTASPDLGYKVLKWTINGDVYTSPLNLPVPTDSMNTLILNVIDDTDDIEITVQFEQIGDKITYGVDGSKGKFVSAINEFTGNEFISGNIISYPTTIALKALPDEGYEVEAWTVDGNVVLSGANNTYDYEADGINGATIKVKFARVPFTVTYGGKNGIVSSSKVVSGKTVRGDTDVQFTSVANPGYKFSSYSVEGKTSYTSTNNPLTVNVTENINVIANFVTDANCVVNYSVAGYNGAITAVKNDNNFINGSFGAANDIITFTAVPNSNYKVKSWTVDGHVISTDNKIYSLTVSNYVHEVTVEFERSHYVLNFDVIGLGIGTIKAKTSSEVLSGSSLSKGSNVKFTAYPAEGYQVKLWKIDGMDVLSSSEELTFEISDLSKDTTVYVEFEVIPEHIITINTLGTGVGKIKAYVNGVERAVVNGFITVKHHDTVRIAAIPEDEYNTADWTVTDLTNYEINKTVVTLNDVTNDVIAKAFFKSAELITVKAEALASEVGNIIGTISAKAGYENDLKTINVVGSTVNVTKGKTLEFKATPSTGYMVKSWSVDGNVLDDLKNIVTMVPDTHVVVKVSFEPIVAYEIPRAGVNYSVSNNVKTPDELPSEYVGSIRQRGTVSFTLVPDSGSCFKQLTICGVDCLTKTGSAKDVKDNKVTVVNNNDGSYTISIENVVKEIERTIVASKPTVTINEVVNGRIVVTYSYIDENQITQVVTVKNGDFVPTNTKLTVQANEDTGYKLESWGGYADGLRNNPIELVVPYNNIVLSAVFNAKSNGGGIVSGGGSFVEPSIIPVPETPKMTFSDILENSWYYDSVKYMYENELMNGMSDAKFSPDSELSRSMLITILYRLEGEPETVASKFSDVESNSWYTKAVAWASSNGIVSGITKELFAPNANITREQIAVILYNFAKYKNLDTTLKSTLSEFVDKEQISLWATEAVKWAVGANLISGKGEGVLDPASTATRAEIATILYRFIKSMI